MIYLDYQATTPLAPEAREAMLRWLEGPEGTGFGNPHSAHRMGRSASAAIEAARERVAALLPAGGRVIFTSGATEALNTALRGTGGDVLTFATEHAAVLDCMRPVEASRRAFTVLPVRPDGRADIAALEEAAGPATGLVAAMAINNEIGTRHPLGDIVRIARAKGALVLVDAVQAYGRVPLTELDADFIAISAHKIHGPKGIGALWIRDGEEVEPLMFGGGQEAKLRSGTLSPALCAGFGAAAQIAEERMTADAEHIEALWTRARELFAEWTLNGSASERWHGNLNIRREGLDVSRLMSDCRNVMFSAGSACASGSGRPSHVLSAIGLSDREAKASIRLGFGRYTRRDDIEQAARAITEAAGGQWP
ncbi:cysteine desulfurase [Erythrobacter litoralis]|jgi:cysteine desulfurase|uniref:Cysteine desulfurase n=1 Tax=Erythrobacter litoralis TaxID=39960 RepID=A0A074N359_9SPHN|nr:cysteine desulfurase family protein [Erythrobacter litoralis]AOL24223.1 cysteine desulfurase [Erythrobacter litoralis]KEO99260.1 aminotransferase [Erythrobacter litoralis]MEE4338877.1 cysteine desulfurase family protein [Erythrobacter sp.]